MTAKLPPPQFCDFSRMAIDLLTEHYNDENRINFTSKIKATDQLYVNARMSNKSELSTDFQYDASKTLIPGLGLKLTLSPEKGENQWKFSSSYKVFTGKARADFTRNTCEAYLDGNSGPLSFSHKIRGGGGNSGTGEASLAYAVAPHCAIGGILRYALQKHESGGMVGARYAHNGVLVSLGYSCPDASYRIATACPINLTKNLIKGGAELTAAAQLTGTKEHPLSAAEVGVEAKVCHYLLRARFNSAMRTSLCLIGNMPGKITGALSLNLNKNMNFSYGISLTYQ